MAMELVEHIEVGAGGAASIEFTGIPQDGVDLVLQYSARNTGTSFVTLIQFNGDTGTNYDEIDLYGSGSSSASGSQVSGNYFIPFGIVPSSYTANTFSNSEMYLSNYTSSSAKSASLNSVTENNSTTSYQMISAAKWAGTSAVSSIKLQANGGNFAQYSTASLYKIY